MLLVEIIAKIRRDHFVEGKGIKEISRKLCLSRNTVRKVIRSGTTKHQYQRIAHQKWLTSQLLSSLVMVFGIYHNIRRIFAQGGQI